MSAPTLPRVGVSACLLGREVRWDGGHKRDPLITGTLGPRFEWVPVCPEEEIGLGVPREPLRLEGDPAAPRLVFRDTRTDITDRMLAWAAERADRLAGLDLCGFILKSDSPSCGREGVEVHDPASRPGPGAAGAGSGAASRLMTGSGLFARALKDRLPQLPVEDDASLRDPRSREEFVARVLAYRDQRGGGHA